MLGARVALLACLAGCSGGEPAAEPDQGVPPAQEDPGAPEPESDEGPNALPGEGRDPAGAAGRQQHAGKLLLPGGSALRPEVEPRLPLIGTTLDQARIVDVLRSAERRRLTPVGTEALVFRARLHGEIDATFRPRTRDDATGWAAEVMAYRIARFLRISTVPPAVVWQVGRQELRELLDPEAAELWPDIERAILPGQDGTIPGAAAMSTPEARDTGFGRGRSLREVLRMLGPTRELDPARTTIAADVAALVVFDYLTGHVRRMELGTVLTDGAEARAYAGNNALAFEHPLSDRLDRRALDRVLSVQRFPRTMMRRLVRLDEAALEELAAGPDGPLLDAERLAAVSRRRAALLSYVGALIETEGEARVLIFP